MSEYAKSVLYYGNNFDLQRSVRIDYAALADDWSTEARADWYHPLLCVTCKFVTERPYWHARPLRTAARRLSNIVLWCCNVI